MRTMDDRKLPSVTFAFCYRDSRGLELSYPRNGLPLFTDFGNFVRILVIILKSSKRTLAFINKKKRKKNL